MSQSKVGIWNIALKRLGAGNVSLDTEDTTKAITMASLWESCLREVLEAAPWPCATVISAMTELGNYTCPPGWLYGYQYPPKALTVWSVYPDTGTSSQYNSDLQESIDLKKKYEFRKIFNPGTNSHVLLTNVEDAYCEYTYFLEDPTLFDEAFISALAFRLAADAAMPLTGDEKMAQAMMANYNNAVSEAKRIVAAENNVGTLGQSSTLDSRG